MMVKSPEGQPRAYVGLEFAQCGGIEPVAEFTLGESAPARLT
jgi:hypothetical protein